MSNIELLTPFVIVAYTMWATPGPNNMMLVYSGANFGFKRTLPHLFGIILGTCLLNMAAVFGLKPLIDKWPVLMLVLKITGSIWLVLIGWKMANASNTQADREQAKPMRFIAAALFQFANPKAVTATLALVSLILVAIEGNDNLLWLIVLIIPPLSFASIIPWVLAGRAIRRFLSTDLRWKIFTRGTGALTASCAMFLWL
ncbi:LysE family translocator [Gammaproteobacteria bacterium AS21]|jgi:threonine/homoserine/homoserine lactone efflux protein